MKSQKNHEISEKNEIPKRIMEYQQKSVDFRKKFMESQTSHEISKKS